MASQMKLCESPDFKDAILAAANHFSNQGLTEQFIEKDYYITEALRILARLYPDEPNRVVFKGGTSLSKGWNLIERFSEDIDIFLNPNTSQPNWGQNKIDKALKTIESKVEEHPNLQISQGGRSAKGISRSIYYTYDQQVTGILPNRILLEIGIRSGDYPIESVQLSSFLSDFLRETDDTFGAEDESTFSMMLLHFKRTFVEKLFAIHDRVNEYQQRGKPIDQHARHYYDLYQLAQRDEIKQLLESADFRSIKQDCDRLSKSYFGKDYLPPANLNFANSLAIFPTGDLRQTVSKAYTDQCKILCYGTYPTWEEIERCFSSIRNHL
jgi:predicted nucleotidyltransferase component of viral defense system